MNQQIYASTPDQLRTYVQELLQAQIQNKQEIALSTLFQYITRKKHQWSIHLQKITYHFFDLSFTLNKHYLTKQVLKAYRSVTQSQYTDSLKVVLEYYRDKRLQTILREDILTRDINQIIEIQDIQNEQSPQDLLISSYKIEDKKFRDSLKNNMKIVWDGYKSIIQTVKINQKLEDLYIQTLQKLFQFAEKFNRKYEFKRFCDTIRTSLQNLFNKNKIIQTQNQKAMYIDIEKSDVNQRNVLSRLQQFQVAVKLKLWQQSFQILQDINLLFKVRKGALKKLTLMKYYFNLSRLFRKSSYWNYHAFAYFNYYNLLRKYPKVTSAQTLNTTNYLLLSVMCIPPFLIQKHQSDQSQNKICALITSTHHIPNKDELHKLVVEKGILEHGSEHIRELWNFLFIDFNILEVPNKIYLLKQLEKSHQDFTELIQNIIIYYSLIQISKIYKKIRFTNILKIIPFNKQSIMKILLTTREKFVIQFLFDQKNNLIIFTQKQTYTSSFNQILTISKEVSFLAQSLTTSDTDSITFQANNSIVNCIDKRQIRKKKIYEFKQFLRKPKKQLQQQQKQQQQRQIKRQLQQQKIQKQKQKARKQKQIIRTKQINIKKIVIKDIISIKQKRLIKVFGKKIEELDQFDLDNITVQDLEQLNRQTIKKNKTQAQNKFKKSFIKSDYTQRIRRQKLKPIYQQDWSRSEIQIQKALKISRQDFQISKINKQKFMSTQKFITQQIEKQTEILKKKYEQQLVLYNKRITNQYKSRIVERAKQLKQQAQLQRKKQQEQKAKRQVERLKRLASQQQTNDVWIRGKPMVILDSNDVKKSDDLFIRRTKVQQIPKMQQWKRQAPKELEKSIGINPLFKGKQEKKDIGNFRVKQQKKQISKIPVFLPSSSSTIIINTIPQKQQKTIGLGLLLGKKFDEKSNVKKQFGFGKKQQKKQDKPVTKLIGRKFL